MIARIILLLLVVLFNLGLQCTAAFAYENALFGYTHMLPSPYTPPAGRLALGTTTGIGITDFFELQTNVLSDLFQIYNAEARFSLLDFPSFALGLFLGYQYTNLNVLSSNNPPIGLGAWMPGGVVGIEVIQDIALFLGGNLFFPNVNPNGLGIDTSGYLQGAQVESDVSWAYNPGKKQVGNVISAGATYNFTFGFYGVGLSHHWKGFQIGFHYYPNASNLKVYPIFAGGAVVEL